MANRPVFQWKTVDGAESYELMVSGESAFTDPVIVKTGDFSIPSTVWSPELDLGYDTTYYWKVRAMSSSTYSP